MREIRFLKGELRAAKDGDKNYLEGYAARYNVLSSDLGGFRERIAPGTFKRTLAEGADVRHLINHDPNRVLGRTAANTLKLSEDENGLRFRCLLPDTTYARDLMESVSRGDINECSFGFMVRAQAWIEQPEDDDDDDNGDDVRYIRELRDLDLFDTSTVTYPAYPETNTQLSARSTGLPENFAIELAELKALKTSKAWAERAKLHLRLREAA